jgi:hypothetical protein
MDDRWLLNIVWIDLAIIGLAFFGQVVAGALFFLL